MHHESLGHGERNRSSAGGGSGTSDESRAAEIARVCRVVGKEGLVWPTTEVTRAIGAVAKGDLGQAMALDVDGRPLEGELLRSAQLVNKMIDQLSVFTSEVTRVAREVGTEGKLGRRVLDLPNATPPLMVALTGWGMESDRRRTGEAGFDHHLVKPVALDEMRTILGTVRAGAAR
ncbi:hypothetical protein BH11MYX2_BH11MYX2_18330 [soil metagenome]